MSLKRIAQRARLSPQKLYEVLHPNEPWIARGAVRFLDATLSGEEVGLEWGSGRSTAWLASRLQSLTSVEHNQDWFSRVQGRVRHLKNVDLRLIELDHPQDEPARIDYDALPEYVRVALDFQDETIGLAFVDGHYRQACVKAVISKVAPNGLLVIDNTDWISISDWGVPSRWPIEHQSQNARGETTIWSKPG